jgi:hypothetical protein
MAFISQKLVELIERHADELTKDWLHDVHKNSGMPTCRNCETEKLFDQTFSVFDQLSKWISRDERTKADISRTYLALGRQRRAEGIPLSEVLQGLILAKRRLWLKVLSDGILDTALGLHQALELNNRVVLFFDRAIFYTTVGYEES